MNNNEPMPATAAVGVLTEDEVVAVDTAPVVVHLPAPAPTWRKANLRDIWAWVGIGAGSVIVIEVLAITAYGIGQAL